eukprot:4650377-Pyramimonas_sp.AAC.1
MPKSSTRHQLGVSPAPCQLGQELTLKCMDVFQRARIDGDTSMSTRRVFGPLSVHEREASTPKSFFIGIRR